MATDVTKCRNTTTGVIWPYIGAIGPILMAIRANESLPDKPIWMELSIVNKFKMAANSHIGFDEKSLKCNVYLCTNCCPPSWAKNCANEDTYLLLSARVGFTRTLAFTIHHTYYTHTHILYTTYTIHIFTIDLNKSTGRANKNLWLDSSAKILENDTISQR